MSRNPFDELDYEGFRRAAVDPTLSDYAKIGFPDSYRAGREAAILADIEDKLSNLRRAEQRVLDIGPGCSPLPRLLIARAQERRQTLFLADSAEMLAQLPDGPEIVKLRGRFPHEQREFVEHQRGALDAILAYSVLHYVFAEGNLHDFIDTAVSLLGHGGQLMVGDIPNLSQRRRFFSSPAGAEFHRAYTGGDDPPVIDEPGLAPGRIDDAVLLGLVARYRDAGYDAYLLPQAADLPMANRREDLLVVRP